MAHLTRRQSQILEYISMAGHSIKHENYSRRQAIEKVYHLCKDNDLKATRRTITELIDLEIRANDHLQLDFSISQECWKEQRDYFFWNPKA